MTTDNTRPTGPRTEAGKAISSRNSTKHGLFTKRDFILAGEDEEYAQTFTALMAEIAPEGILEQTFATEIMGATWRLRRCGILEFSLARSSDPTPDAQTAIQKSIDRARSQSHNILRRSLAEIRNLQTERHTRILNFPPGEVPTDLGVTDTRHAVKSAARSILADSSFCKPPESAPTTAENPTPENPTASNPAGSSFCKPAESAPTTVADPAPNRSGAPKFGLAEIEEQWRRDQKEFEAFLDGRSFCKRPAATPRNAPCPCGSGAKYKRCCGKNAPPVLNMGSKN